MARRNIERTLLDTEVGPVRLHVFAEYDSDPDTSYLGEFCNYREPSNEDEKLYHRRSGLVLDHHGLWRNERGQIQAAPECERRSRECGYIFCDNGCDRIAYAVQNARRLERLNDGWWSYVGVVAEVELDGLEIGSSSVWGVESDSDDSYFTELMHDEAAEALAEAHKCLERLLENAPDVLTALSEVKAEALTAKVS